jgi:hypothetical protein
MQEGKKFGRMIDDCPPDLQGVSKEVGPAIDRTLLDRLINVHLGYETVNRSRYPIRKTYVGIFTYAAWGRTVRNLLRRGNRVWKDRKPVRAETVARIARNNSGTGFCD